MIAAALDTVEEVGYARMTVAQVIARARISRKTFYDVFVDREDCFLAALEHALSEATRPASEAYKSESGWREGTRVALARLLMFIEEEPRLARLLILGSLVSGDKVLSRRGQVVDNLAKLIDHGRLVNDRGSYPPPLTGVGVVGGVLAVLHAHLLQERQEPIRDLLGPLMSMIVLPYLGVKAARHEINRPGSPPGPRSKRASRPASAKNPLEGLNMRLTNRSVRVLMAIAEHPGACNREVAERSGIVDQSQISKLLARLARLNLAENLGKGQQAGTTNAWRLTPLGAKLERATRPL
jgi:AcrR family transcriptional regulator/DNA-binding MarR family transcriptional regulator